MRGINPQVRFIDLTHDVSPQNVLQGAFLLGTSWRYFPEGTVHLAVVDPGVGTERKALVVEGGGHYFVAPDNGLLSFVLPSYPPGEHDTLRQAHGTEQRPSLFSPYHAALPHGFRAYTLTSPRYWLPNVSNTFHGRDVFAPVAAHLSSGVPLEKMGEPVDTVTRLAIPSPHWEGARIVGCVLHIDHFGNIVTSVKAETLSGLKADIEVQVGGRSIRGLVKAYGQGSGLVALIGSHGYLEVALANGNAAQAIGVRVGDEVLLKRV